MTVLLIVTWNFLCKLRDALVNLGEGAVQRKAPLYVHSRDRKLSMEMRELLEGLLPGQGLRYLCKDDQQTIVKGFGKDNSRGRGSAAPTGYGAQQPAHFVNPLKPLDSDIEVLPTFCRGRFIVSAGSYSI
jgi:hypothetical protein